MLFIKFLDLLKRIIGAVGSSGFSERGPVIHDEDLATILKGTNVMVSPVGPNYKNRNLGLIGGVDAIKSFLGK